MAAKKMTMPSNIDNLVEKAAKLSVRGPPVELAEKMAPGTRAKEQQELIANVWGVVPARNVPVFRYDIRILEEFPPKKGTNVPSMKEVTKQTRDDYLSVERKNKSIAVFTLLMKNEKNFFGQRNHLVYDRASILYSLHKLSIDESSAGDQESKAAFTINPKELPKELINADCLKIHVAVKACNEDFELTMNDLKSCVNLNPEKVNRSLQQFLEILVSQEVFFTEGEFVSYGTGECYLMNPTKFSFRDQDMPDLGEGKYVGIGASKGIRMIEGPQGPGGLNAAVIIDVKKAAFHVEHQKVLEKVAQILKKDVNILANDPRSVSVISKALKGLHVYTEYGKFRHFQISGISKESAKTHRVMTKEGNMSVEEYFAKKYEIKLTASNLPLVIERSQPTNNYYPMELLFVCENQRVSQSQQSATQVQAMIRTCATVPAHRLRQTISMTSAMKLDNGGNNNRWLKECGVKMTNHLMFPGRVLPPPSIQYAGNGFITVNAEKANWIADKSTFIIAAKCGAWYAVALMSSREGRFREDSFKEYIRAFLAKCKARGMQIGAPLATEYVARARIQDIDVHIKKAKSMGATFVHFITSDELSYHDHIKYLEVQEQIVTQNLKSSTAGLVPRRPQTLDNIVNKTNLKLGGLNFSLQITDNGNVDLMKEKRLIVGLDIAHPPAAALRGREKSDVPSVIGYAANIKKHPLDFIGGYHYGKAQMEELVDDSLSKIMVELMKNFNKNRGAAPDHIMVVRDGISEGQYKYVVSVEVDQMKKACAMLGGERYRPHITFVVLTKMHSLRLYKKTIPAAGKAAEQNIKPGTIVDKHIVNPLLNEFYLNSHSAFQGTTKTPRYTVLYDTAKMKADEMQGLILALAYNFQIVNAAVSRPSPVMVANRMAKRGRNNYIAMFGDETESSNGNGAEKDLNALNMLLGYSGKPLSQVRFNA